MFLTNTTVTIFERSIYSNWIKNDLKINIDLKNAIQSSKDIHTYEKYPNSFYYKAV